jgi:hypothetical protein
VAWPGSGVGRVGATMVRVAWPDGGSGARGGGLRQRWCAWRGGGGGARRVRVELGEAAVGARGRWRGAAELGEAASTADRGRSTMWAKWAIAPPQFLDFLYLPFVYTIK